MSNSLKRKGCLLKAVGHVLKGLCASQCTADGMREVRRTEGGSRSNWRRFGGTSGLGPTGYTAISKGKAEPVGKHLAQKGENCAGLSAGQSVYLIFQGSSLLLQGGDHPQAAGRGTGAAEGLQAIQGLFQEHKNLSTRDELTHNLRIRRRNAR